jgi:hypothetical protein
VQRVSSGLLRVCLDGLPLIHRNKRLAMGSDFRSMARSTLTNRQNFHSENGLFMVRVGIEIRRIDWA